MNLAGASIKGTEKVSRAAVNASIKRGLDPAGLMLLHYEFDKKKKNKFAMVLLWFFFGWLGAHRFYTRDHLYATMMLLFGWATLFTWNIIDVLFAAKEVDRVNEDIEYEILQNINRAH